MGVVTPMVGWHRVWLGATLMLLGVWTSGCAGPPASDPAKAELLRHTREAYLFNVDVSGLELLSVPEIVARLDPDTRLVEMRRMSLNFIRGFEPEGSVMNVQAVGGGRGALRLAFLGRRMRADMEKGLDAFAPPLCALTIDLRNNAGGSFEQALRLAERFLPSEVLLAVSEEREGRALLYATGTAKLRQERLTLVINGQTASSAELFAGILQWRHRAELVGSPTHGNHTIQRVARLDQQHLLFLTTGRFLASDGTPFGVNGLMPDRAFEGDDMSDLMEPCAASRYTGP